MIHYQIIWFQLQNISQRTNFVGNIHLISFKLTQKVVSNKLPMEVDTTDFAGKRICRNSEGKFVAGSLVDTLLEISYEIFYWKYVRYYVRILYELFFPRPFFQEILFRWNFVAKCCFLLTINTIVCWQPSNFLGENDLTG